MTMAIKVARMTAEPIEPTICAPVVNRPTPTTVPTVMVTASRIPSVRFSVSFWGVLIKISSLQSNFLCAVTGLKHPALRLFTE